jgi:deoxyribonuclease IV
MSVAGGTPLAPERGAAFRCTAIQVFTKNGNQWGEREVSREEGEAFRASMARHGVEAALSHDSYLINLAAPGADLRKKSLRSFLAEVRRCAALGIPTLVFHPGAHVGEGEAAGIRRVAAGLRETLRRTEGLPVTLAIETTAGQGSSLGHSFEHLRDLIDGAGAGHRLGICFDTCHVHASGRDLSTEEGVARCVEDFDRIVGLDRLRAFHLNDCKKPAGSRVDRHQHIGRGTIGLAGFRALARDDRFAPLPKVLETPKGPDPVSKREWDAVNLGRLRRLGMR